jgi:hypothetical protein
MYLVVLGIYRADGVSDSSLLPGWNKIRGIVGFCNSGMLLAV